MTLALSTTPPLHSPMDLIADLHQQVDDWRDIGALASTTVEILRSALPHVAVSIHRFERESQAMVLLATDPREHGGAVGARTLLGDDILAEAVRSGEVQRSINAYVKPDFVRSLPGETRSEIVLPIRSGAEVHGVIRLIYASPHLPSDSEEAMAAWVALHLGAPFALVGTAASDEGLGGDRAVLADELSVLASHLAQSGDLNGVLKRVAATALRLVPGEASVVLLRHESRQMLEVSATAGSALAMEGELVPLDRSAPGQVAREGQPKICGALTEDQGSFSPLDQERGIRNALLVPLSAAGKTYGVLAVLNRSGGEFTPGEVDTLQNVANQAAAVDSMRSVGPLRERLSDSSLIAEVGRAVTGTLGLDEVLAVVVRAAEMLVSGRCAAVALLSEDRENLTLAATSGSLLTRQGDEIPVHGSLTGWAVLSSDTIVSASIGNDPRRHQGESKLGPGVIIPIESGSRVHGALLAARKDDADVPSDGDVDALKKLAAYASIAIENARLYREQTELSQKLQAKTEELEKAYEDLNNSQERLLVSEKMAALGRVTAGIAHEINSPLGGILNCLQMASTYVGEYRSSIDDPDVTREDHEAIARDLTEALDLAEHSTRKVAQFVRTIKGQTRTGEGELRVEFEAVDEIEGVVAVLQHELRSRQVTLHSEIQPGIPMTGDPGKFSLIVQNLLKNAIDAYEGSEGDVFVRWTSADGTKAQLEVEDRGTGIAEEIRGRIFDYLFTTKDIGEGTGLGLSTVHSIVTTHFEGEVRFESTVGSGTTFFVTFPIFPPRD